MARRLRNPAPRVTRALPYNRPRDDNRRAPLLASLQLEEGARIAVQVEKSVEAMMLYLATLRAGYVFLPLNTAYQKAEIEYFVGNAEPAVVVCSPANFGWVSKIAFQAGTQHVFTLGDDRNGSLLERAAKQSDRHQPVQRSDDDLAAILYTSGTTGRPKGAMSAHRQSIGVARAWAGRPSDIPGERIRDELFKVRTDLASSLVREGEFTEPVPGLTVYAQSVDSNGVIHNLFIHQAKTDGGSTTYTTIHSMPVSHTRWVKLGGVYEHDPSSPPSEVIV